MGTGQFDNISAKLDHGAEEPFWCFMTDESHTYSANPVHRNGTLGKSQWTIPVPDEDLCFTRAVARGWILKNVGWGLHDSGTEGQIDYLGVARDHRTLVFIAKFIGNSGAWHGFPADHQQSRLDIPDSEILKKWMVSKSLSNAKIRKIVRGQSCHL